tara:strand:+ start:834 stop:1379 length:546 start_codon:yes stop_codon:yes gene_type:complete
MSNERLFRLKNLVEELSNRDQKIKEDLNLFEEVFDAFPVPVVFWSVNLEGDFFTKKLSCGDAWTALNHDCENISDFYRCSTMQEQFNGHFSKMSEGIASSFLTSSGDTYIWHRVVPRKDRGGINSILGLSWDVTSNHYMLSTLKKIQNVSKDKPELSEIKLLADEGVSSSRLNKLLQGDKK